MSSEPVISAANLGKVYHLYDKPADRLKQAFFWGRKQFFREFWALRNVTIDVHRGQVMGLIGRNGSGKSTLLQLVCGVLQPTCGTVKVNGRVAALLELGSGFNPEFTGRENVYLNATILGLTRQQIDQRFDKILAFAEIGAFIDQPVKTYSSGMVVRLAFAITVHVDADILVVDEALSVGDTAFQFKCLHHLEELLERGVVSHDVQLVKSYCTNAIYLKDNLIVYQGDCETATELYLKDTRAQKESQLPAAPGPSSPRSGSSQIVSVRMGSGESDRVDFDGGQRVWVDVIARVDPEIRRPRLTLYVRDIKGYGLFGFNNHHARVELSPASDGTISGRFSFTCDLRQGPYSIAVRLEECLSDTLTLLIDKRLNAINFKVVSDSRPFFGVVNLNGSFEPISGLTSQ
jgi:lipopolysaccharide transport system ATP-binding protein